MAVPLIALLMLGGVAAAAIASKPKSKPKPAPAPKPGLAADDDDQVLLDSVAGAVQLGTFSPASPDEELIVSIALRPPPTIQPRDPGLMAVVADTLAIAEAITQQTGAPHLTGPSIRQIRDWAYRAVLKTSHEGGAKEHIARIMKGQHEQVHHADNIVAHCQAKGINMGMGSGFTLTGFGPPGGWDGYESEAEKCAREYMESLPPMTEYEQSRRLWDLIWRHIKKGFYLKKGPEVKPPAAEVEEMAMIIMEAILSEIDPMRAPDPSMGARYGAIKRRAEQVIEWPRCDDSLEGCKAHRDRRRKDLANLINGYSGEERIVRIAEYTGQVVIERTRTLKVNMPTNFGDFLLEVALPAFAAGVGLAIEIWGVVVGGDDFDWEYPENVYGGGKVNQAIDSATGAYDAAVGAYEEGEETADEVGGAIDTFSGVAFAGRCARCSGARRPRCANYGAAAFGGACCDRCAAVHPIGAGGRAPGSYFGATVGDMQRGVHVAAEAAAVAVAAPFLWWASNQTQDSAARAGLRVLAAATAVIDTALLASWAMGSAED